MTRPRGEIPQPRYHKAKNRMYVRIDGRQIYLGPPDTDEFVAKHDRLIAEWLSNGRSLSAAGRRDASYLVRDLVADYLVAFEEEHLGSRQPENLKHAVRPLLRMWGGEPVGEFRPPDLKALRRHLIDKGLSLTTINQRMTMLKAMFMWAVEEERLDPTVALALKAVKNLRRTTAGVKQPKVIEPAPQEHVDAVLENVSPPIAAMIRLQLLTGMRPGEVLIMRGVDMQTSDTPWTYQPSTHKNQWRKHDRVIAIGPRAREVLGPFLSARLPTAYIFSPKEADAWHRAQKRANRLSKETPSQARRRRQAMESPKARLNDCYDVHGYRRVIVRACERAGVPAWTPHQLRHAAATNLERALGIEASRAVLGHTSTRVTDRYVQEDHSKSARAMEELG